MKTVKISKEDYDTLKDAVDKYWKRYKTQLHPCFEDGAYYVLKHLTYEEIDETF